MIRNSGNKNTVYKRFNLQKTFMQLVTSKNYK